MKVCRLCYRKFEEGFFRGDYCITCLSIIGKGPGYKNNYMSDQDAEKWFEGWKERKKQRIKEGYIKT